MHWYDGNIAEAVALSKQKNAIFVVFVEGNDEQSAELAQTLDSSAVSSRLGDQTSFLAVKLKSGSDTYLQFARIYQLVPVPSLFFIGRSGTPLEVVCAGVTPDTLATRIDRILSTHKSDTSFLPSTSSQNMREQTVNFLQAEAGPANAQPAPAHPMQQAQPSTSGPAIKRPSTSSEEPTVTQKDATPLPNTSNDHEVICDGDVCVKRPKTDHSDPGPSGANTVVEPSAPVKPSGSDQSISEEEKIEKAKALIEARRREQADKEKELEKLRELERRNTGKSVAELKRWQADQELKQIQEERKREKMENNLARQRILEQIAQDRAERRARDQPAVPPPQPTATSPPTTSGGDATGRTRIQFKLPDGQSHTAHFDSEDTLATVRDYIANNLQMSSSQFSLWTAFPRCELTDGSASLRALALAPSAALLVMPIRPPPTSLVQPSAVSAAIAFLTNLFTRFVVYPCNCAMEWFRLNVWGPRGDTIGTGDAQPRATVDPIVPQVPPVARDDAPRPVRRIANIHRLSPDRNAEDDNNTWNGNSTQQM